MGIKRYKPEEIVTKLRQVDVLVGEIEEQMADIGTSAIRISEIQLARPAD